MKRKSAISLSMLDLITNALGMFLVQMFVVSTFRPPIHRERVQGTIVVEGIADDPRVVTEVQLVLRQGGRLVETLDSGEIRRREDDLSGEWPSTARAKRDLLSAVPLAMVYENPASTAERVAVLRNPRPGDLEMTVLYADQPLYRSSDAPAAKRFTLRTYVALAKQKPQLTTDSKILAGTGATKSESAKVVVVP